MGLHKEMNSMRTNEKKRYLFFCDERLRGLMLLKRRNKQQNFSIH